MNTKEKEIDRLTRALMEDVIETPAPSLNTRVMARLRKEKRASVKPLPSFTWLIGLCVVYLILGIVCIVLFKTEGGSLSYMEVFKRFFPLFLAIAAPVSFFFFLTLLDLRLRDQGK